MKALSYAAPAAALLLASSLAGFAQNSAELEEGATSVEIGAEKRAPFELAGLYVGMEENDALAVAKKAGFGWEDIDIDADPETHIVHTIQFSPHALLAITGVKSFQNIVAEIESQFGAFELIEQGNGPKKQIWRELDSNGYLATLSATEIHNIGIPAGLKISNVEACNAAREKESTAAALAMIADMVEIPGRDFKMGRREVTQEQWEAVTGHNPSAFKGADRPVETVSWTDCQAFTKTLNELPAVVNAGVRFRLPTAEEWEYACRAGSEGSYGLLKNGKEGDLAEMGWFKANSEHETHPVGSLAPNAWGLYDMHGNVWEWTSTSAGTSKIHCGGSWFSEPSNCTSSFQFKFTPAFKDDATGFRLCIEAR